MGKAKVVVLIRRVAAILLMACFFMPLSRCTVKAHPELRKTEADFYLYGHQMAQDALRDIQDGQLDGVATLTGLLIIFFVPAVCLRLKDTLQAPIYLLSSVASGYLLYSWIFVFATRVEIGGVIAVICWIMIFCAACMSLGSRWRSLERSGL